MSGVLGVWNTAGSLTSDEVDAARPLLAEHSRTGSKEPVRILGRWWFFDDMDPSDPPMTVTVDLEDNPTLVGWVMNDE